MIDMIKDFFLFTFMIALMFWCVFHDFEQKIGRFFKRPVKQPPAIKQRPKFQGSAQVWLK